MKDVRTNMPLNAAVFMVGLLLCGSAHAEVAQTPARSSILVMLADLDDGLALIPEGTVVPRGLKVYAQRVVNPQVRGAATGRPLVFAYAPEASFAEARKAIQASEEQLAEAVGPDPAGLATATASREAQVASSGTEMFYVYYPDGSYHRAERYTSVGPGSYRVYGANTFVFAAAGDYYRGSATAGTSSTWTTFQGSTSTSFGPSGGQVYQGNAQTQTWDPNLSITVDSTGRVSHSYSPICGRYGEPPCREVFTSTIRIQFP